MPDPKDPRDPKAPEEGTPPPKKEPKGKGKKEKGRRRGCGLFLLSVLLVLGLLGGMQASGALDLRGLVYPLIPRLPGVGPSLASALGIPEVYALSAQERRALELLATQESLAELKRRTEADRRGVDKVSRDLTLREQDVERLQKELTERLKALVRSDDTQASTGVTPQGMKDLLQTYQDMSPRNAAQILEKVDEELAVTLLGALPQDQTAKILGRMDATRAARLTERLSQRTGKQP